MTQLMNHPIERLRQAGRWLLAMLDDDGEVAATRHEFSRAAAVLRREATSMRVLADNVGREDLAQICNRQAMSCEIGAAILENEGRRI